jgi:hypothetical protein
MKIFLSFILIAYLYFSIKTQKKILKYHVFNRQQKIIHSILVWLLPFIWGYVLRAVMNPTPGSAEMYNKRQDQQPHFYESKKGFWS